MIGTLKEFSSESAASRAAEGLRFKLNQDKRQLSPIKFGFLINHYVEHELPKASKSTHKTNLGYIKNWIEPKWHYGLACEMKTMEIEVWLHSITRPDGTKLKIKGIMSTIFSHGVRWELVEHNPICGQGATPGHRGASTGARQSGKLSIQRVVLTPQVVEKVLEGFRCARRHWIAGCRDGLEGLRIDRLEVEGCSMEDRDAPVGSGHVPGRAEGHQDCDNDLPLAES